MYFNPDNPVRDVIIVKGLGMSLFYHNVIPNGIGIRTFSFFYHNVIPNGIGMRYSDFSTIMSSLMGFCFN